MSAAIRVVALGAVRRGDALLVSEEPAPELGTKHRARWMPIERLRADDTTFYVPAVLDALGR